MSVVGVTLGDAPFTSIPGGFGPFVTVQMRAFALPVGRRYGALTAIPAGPFRPVAMYDPLGVAFSWGHGLGMGVSDVRDLESRAHRRNGPLFDRRAADAAGRAVARDKPVATSVVTPR